MKCYKKWIVALENENKKENFCKKLTKIRKKKEEKIERISKTSRQRRVFWCCCIRAEINQFHMELLVDDNVLVFDVTMYNHVRMEIGNGRDKLSEYVTGQRLFDVSSLSVDELEQVHATFQYVLGDHFEAVDFAASQLNKARRTMAQCEHIFVLVVIIATLERYYSSFFNWILCCRTFKALYSH